MSSSMLMCTCDRAVEIYQRVNVHPYADLRRMDFVDVVVRQPARVAGVTRP